MALHWAEAYVDRFETAMAVTRACKLCTFVHTRKKYAGVGRGYGMRVGNKQRGLLIQHVKTVHPELNPALKAPPDCSKPSRHGFDCSCAMKEVFKNA